MTNPEKLKYLLKSTEEFKDLLIPYYEGKDEKKIKKYYLVGFKYLVKEKTPLEKN